MKNPQTFLRQKTGLSLCKVYNFRVWIMLNWAKIQKSWKKKNFFENSIDKIRKLGYNSQAPHREAANFAPWKLNNMKFRALKSAKDLVKTLWKKETQKSKKKLEKNSSKKDVSLGASLRWYTIF